MIEPKKLAEALDCFWNAAIGEAHTKQDSTAFAVVACIAEGVQAVANRLREIDQLEMDAVQLAMALTEIQRFLGAPTADDIMPLLREKSR